MKTGTLERDIVLVELLAELGHCRATGDLEGQIDALCVLAWTAIRRDDLAGATNWARQAYDLARATTDRRLEQSPLHLLAGAARLSGNLRTARTMLERSIELHEALGDWQTVLIERHNLAYLELKLCDAAKARDLFAAARRAAVRAGRTDLFPTLVVGRAVMAAMEGDPARAARYLAAVDTALTLGGRPLDPDDAREHQTLRDRLTVRLGAAYAGEYDAGAGLDLAVLVTA